MDTPKTKTIKVTFLDTTSIQYIEIAVVTYGDKRELRYNCFVINSTVLTLALNCSLDENDKISSYIREHGLFETNN